MEADIGDFQHPSGTQNQTSRNNQPTKSLAGHKQSMNDSRNVGFTVHKTAMYDYVIVLYILVGDLQRMELMGRRRSPKHMEIFMPL